MSVWYHNTYWLLGDGADAEAQRWIAKDNLKKIRYSSPKAVELVEIGNHLSPELPVPPDGFMILVISDVDVYGMGPTFGVSHSCGHGGWIERSHYEDLDGKPSTLDDYDNSPPHNA